MSITLAFDIYGTLIDTQGVMAELQQTIGEHAAAFSQRWREKQLEYTFRRGLMNKYVDFSVCTRQALEYCNEWYQTDLSEQDKIRLMQRYAALPVFDDVLPLLTELQQQSVPMYAFSNGTADAVANLLQHAGIRDFFADIISVDEIRTFKPNPEVYRHFLKRTNSAPSSSWLISSNPFDIIGASAIGMQTAWIKRSTNAIFDPWEITPSATIGNLKELVAVIQSA